MWVVVQAKLLHFAPKEQIGFETLVLTEEGQMALREDSEFSVSLLRLL